jgi:hypothetical protein
MEKKLTNYTHGGKEYFSTKEAMKKGYTFSSLHAITPGVIHGVNQEGEKDLFFLAEMLGTYTSDRVPIKGDPFEIMRNAIMRNADGSEIWNT